MRETEIESEKREKERKRKGDRVSDRGQRHRDIKRSERKNKIGLLLECTIFEVKICFKVFRRFVTHFEVK